MTFDEIFEIPTNLNNVKSTDNSPVNSKCDRLIEFYVEYNVPLHSIIVIQDDVVLCEKYFGLSAGVPNSKFHLHRMYSITKSLTSLAIGFLLEDKKLSLSDSVTDYYDLLKKPEWQFDSPDNLPDKLKKTTIKDMLSMRTCHTKTTYKADMSKDWVESFFTTPPSKTPGEEFTYDTSATHVLTALVEAISQMDMWDFLKSKLSPLEFSKESYIIKDPFGISVGGSGLMSTTRDLAVLAYFIEHHGIIGDSKILPRRYIDEATSVQVATKGHGSLPFEQYGYGYFFWCGENDEYMAYGKDGQFIYFMPKQNLIFITTADTSADKALNQTIIDGFHNF